MFGALYLCMLWRYARRLFLCGVHENHIKTNVNIPSRQTVYKQRHVIILHCIIGWVIRKTRYRGYLINSSTTVADETRVMEEKKN